MKLAVAVLLLTLGAAKKKSPPPKAPAPPPPPTEPSPKLVDAINEKTANMLVASRKMTLFHVAPQQPGVRPNPQLAVGGEYEKDGMGRELTDGEVKRFKELLYDEKSFGFDKPPQCGDFKPDVAMIGQSEGDTGMLEMLVSFKCNGIMFFTAKTAGRSLPGAQLDFKPARKNLLTMVKELMPQDAAVKALK